QEGTLAWAAGDEDIRVVQLRHTWPDIFEEPKKDQRCCSLGTSELKGTHQVAEAGFPRHISRHRQCPDTSRPAGSLPASSVASTRSWRQRMAIPSTYRVRARAISQPSSDARESAASLSRRRMMRKSQSAIARNEHIAGKSRCRGEGDERAVVKDWRRKVGGSGHSELEELHPDQRCSRRREQLREAGAGRSTCSGTGEQH
ncbi:hypothetical protein B0H14DRAFT_2679080, partial [Mycena olivaceomarginata]